MTNTSGKINLLGLTQPEMEQFFESIGEKRFRACLLYTSDAADE